MSIYRKNKNSMKQADKESARTAKEEMIISHQNMTKEERDAEEENRCLEDNIRWKNKELIFQTEEEKDNETILQTGKIWCDGCYAWIYQVTKTDTNWLCCDACGNGVVMLT